VPSSVMNLSGSPPSAGFLFHAVPFGLIQALVF
jgi:hypothetical protein